MTNSLLDEKWVKFRRRAKLFRYVPFVDFALAAGSMAMGNPKEHSDFDVIVGVKYGRIFTARFFAVIIFDMFGWRRKAAHNKDVDSKSVSDKICLSHFVTPSSYRLSPPHNEYWQKLYQSLVPLWGDKKKIQKFFAANDWLSPARGWKPDEKYIASGASYYKKLKEFALAGKLGDWFEERLKAFQVRRIERGLDDKFHYKPRIIYSDQELEFHPHTKRIEEMITNGRL